MSAGSLAITRSFGVREFGCVMKDRAGWRNDEEDGRRDGVVRRGSIYHQALQKGMVWREAKFRKAVRLDILAIRRRESREQGFTRDV